MKVASPFEFPPEKARIHRRAVVLERWTIAYLISAVFFLYLTLGSSQAMKAAWLEDLLSLVPPIAFLIGSKVRLWKPNARFPYGFHRAVGIAYLCASLALLVMGLFIFYDSVMKLIAFEHSPIGVVQPFGEPIWLGWFMIAALLWSAIPAVILGRMKIPLARTLHDKVLYADAKMNKADWLTATAAMVGVIGIGLGWWWADPIAAIIISVDVAHDGWGNVRLSVTDLMDRRPVSVDGESDEPMVARIKHELLDMPWVKEAQVRLREAGHVFFGDAVVVPREGTDLPRKIQEAEEYLQSLDWRLFELEITPVPNIEEHEDSLGPAPESAG